MPREEHILGSSSYSGAAAAGGAGGGGSGCSSNSRSKKIKQKKVPQRGLGVAQLEKIRLEEQQKKQSVQAVQAANILAKNAICSSTNSNNNNNINNNNNNSPPFLAAQCSNFRPPFHNSAPLPPPPPPPSSPPRTNLPSPKAFYNRHENSVRISKNEKQGFVDHRGFSFEPQVNLPYDPSVLPLPINSRPHQIHRPCSSSSMVNMNSSSVELNSPMEPPSNQSFRSNNYVPSWTDDDKIIGMKRSYPFSLESPPLSQCNFHPKNYSSVSKSDELLAPSIDNRYTANIEPRTKCMIREGPLNSNSLPDRNVREVNRKNERLNGDFLTLAPPNLNSKHGLFENESIPIEEYSKGSESFSFFPIKLPNDETTRHLSIGSNNGEKGETIDLNLKL
ncbi:hypothetical protein ACP275_08G194900 [Erythranthe tilingii]